VGWGFRRGVGGVTGLGVGAIGVVGGLVVLIDKSECLVPF